MNYTLYLEKILPIARALAAMQVLTDGDGGDGRDNDHPLSPLLDDFRLPVVRPLMLQAYLSMVLEMRRYIGEVEIPEPDDDFTELSLSVTVPAGFGGVEADMLLSAMEQIIALGTVTAILRSRMPDGSSENAIAAFSTLAAEYMAKALSILAPPFPPAVMPLYM